VAFVRYSERFVSPIRVLSQEVQNIQEALVSSERVRKMLSEPEETATLGPDGTALHELQGAVEYRDVWMSYQAGHQVLKGVSFKALPGMKVGLVGATGSGKTSTVNLLPRLYPIDKGEILLDGLRIETLARDGLRGQLGYVSQDVVVFSGSIRENLIAALPGATPTDAMIGAACQRTGLTQVLAHFPDGLDHKVVEGGDNLSMGERQLIAFTRMVLRDPRVLILDEATANIDERCERLIQNAITEVMAGRTCFVIAHRLSTIIQCDLILVFRAGEIVEQGTHAQLMAQGGYYASLAGKQLLA
jgi:ABC-type multidrug transport system fused ATPase/permease subunit